MNKNILQEFCQKRKLPLPVYKTIKVGGSSHQPTFMSEVIMQYSETIIYKTATGSSKKTAEYLVATNMLQYLNTLLNEETINYKTQTTVHIWIDMENIHMGTFFEQKNFVSRFSFVGFSTENHPSIKAAPSRINKIKTIKSSRSDACDILMIAYVGEAIHEGLYGSESEMGPISSGDEIIILTKDHFGDALVEYISERNSAVIAINVKSIIELETYLSKYIKT